MSTGRNHFGRDVGDFSDRPIFSPEYSNCDVEECVAQVEDSVLSAQLDSGFAQSAHLHEGSPVSIFRPHLAWVVVLTATLAAPALATPIPVGIGSTVGVKFTGVGPGQGSAGAYNWTTKDHYSGLVYADPATSKLISFCIEQTENTSGNFNEYTLKPLDEGPNTKPMAPGTADALRAMWAEFRDDADDSNAAAAAFQRAVWHLLANPNIVPVPNPGSPSLLAGGSTLFDQFINPNNWNSGFANLAVMSNNGLQDQIVQVTFNADPTPTPEPGMLALGLLVLPAVLLRRRLMKK
jgi:hypothetical protein